MDIFVLALRQQLTSFLHPQLLNWFVAIADNAYLYARHLEINISTGTLYLLIQFFLSFHEYYVYISYETKVKLCKTCFYITHTFKPK